MPINELKESNKMNMPINLGILKYGVCWRKNFTPNRRTKSGITKLVGLPNKRIITPPR